MNFVLKIDASDSTAQRGLGVRDISDAREAPSPQVPQMFITGELFDDAY